MSFYEFRQISVVVYKLHSFMNHRLRRARTRTDLFFLVVDDVRGYIV
jgi:hypothetical protein